MQGLHSYDLPVSSNDSERMNSVISLVRHQCYSDGCQPMLVAENKKFKQKLILHLHGAMLQTDIANIEAGRIPLPNYASAQEHTSMVSIPSKAVLVEKLNSCIHYGNRRSGRSTVCELLLLFSNMRKFNSSIAGRIYEVLMRKR